MQQLQDMYTVVNKTLVNPDGKNVLVTEPGKFGQNISQIDINFDTTGKCYSFKNKCCVNGYHS